MFEALAGDCGGRDGGRDGSEGAGIGAEVDQREEKQVKKKYSIGQPARIIGRSPASAICGAVVRDGVTLYALVGMAGVWPSWVVEAV